MNGFTGAVKVPTGGISALAGDCNWLHFRPTAVITGPGTRSGSLEDGSYCAMAKLC